MANGPVFPAFLRLEHEPSVTAQNSFLAEVAKLSGEVQRKFEGAFADIPKMLERSFASFRGGAANLSVDVPGLNKIAADAEFASTRLALMRDAATSLARSTGDTSTETKLYIQALRAQAVEAERNATAARDQASAFGRLQTEIDKTVSGNQRLADSYRAVYAEQAKAANYATRFQQGVNEVFAPGLDRKPKSAADSASVFTSRQNAGPTNALSGVEALRAGQASIDRAALSFTSLEQVLGRVSVKGREVSAALQEASDTAARAAEQEAQRVAQAKAEEAAAMERYAQAADKLRASLDPSVAIQQRFNAQMEEADTLLKAGAIDAATYGQAQQKATAGLQAAWASLTRTEEENIAVKRRGTSETGNVINGVRAQRVAFTQLGQQMQDVVVQTQMGTSATTIFVQQVPQMAFALSGLAESTNKTYARIGAFASFLSGGWGAAIFAAIAVLGPLAAEILGVGDAEEDAKGKTYDFAEGLNVLELSAGSAAEAMKQLSQEMRNAIAVQGDFLRTKANVAQQSVGELEGLLKSERAELEKLEARFTSVNPFEHLSVSEAYRMGALKDNIPKLQEALKGARAAQVNSDLAVAQQNALERTDPRQGVTGQYNRAVGDLNTRYRESQKNPLGAMDRDQYEAEFEKLTRERDAALEKIKDDNRKPKKNRGGKSEDERAAERAAREAERLSQFGDKAAESIQRINERFNEQPRLVDAAAQATRQLDDIIADLEKRKPAGFEKMVADAEAAKQVVQDALVRPFEELEQSSERRVTIQKLLSSGREAEAAAMQDIWRLEEQLGPLTDERKAQVIAIAKAEQDQIEALQRAQEIQSAFLDATRSVRGEVEAILGGYGKLSNLKNVFQQLRGKLLAEQLFGDVFRDLDKWVKEKTGIGSSVDMMAKETERAGGSAGKLADALDSAAARIASSGSTMAGDASLSEVNSAFDAAFPSSGRRQIGLDPLNALRVGNWSLGNETAPQTINGANDNYAVGDSEILVEGRKPTVAGNTVNNLTIERYAAVLSERVTKPLLDGFDRRLGTSLSKKLSGPLAGALEGYMTTGTGFGAVLGGLKDLKGLPKGLSEGLGKAFKGAQTGAMVSGIGNALGIKMSDTGAQIGGAIGSFIPIPGGQIIGSVIGGLLGGLFKTTKKGYAQVTNNGITTGGNKTQAAGAAQIGGSIEPALARLAEQFGADIGNYSVSIGRRSSGYIIVSASGSSRVADKNYSRNNPKDAIYDGKDEAEAARIALLNAIQDGALKGISQGAQRILQAGKDIDTQVQKALDFDNVFVRLKQYTDPVGASLDVLDKEFERLKKIFAEAGASTEEYAKLEQLYNLDRAKAVKQAAESITGSLKSLLDEITIGNDALSLSDRKAAALAKYNPLKERVKAGDVTAYDDYAAAARDLLNIQREMSGSQSDYFTLLDEVKGLTSSTIDKTKAVADASANRDSPFTSSGTTPANDNASVSNAISAQTQALLDGLGIKLDAVNSNLGSLLRKAGANLTTGGSFKLAGNGDW